MDYESIKSTKKTNAIKVIISVLLLLIVVGIWFTKNFNKESNLVNSENSDFALHVTEQIDINKLKSYGMPIVIDFGADSCIPCKEMAPVLKELNEELQGKAIIKFVDVWKYTDVGEDYPISIIPTQIFIDASGKPYNPKDPDAIQMKLYKMRDTGEHVFTAHEGGLTKDQFLDILKEMGLK
jgi:thioredoxin 1